LLDSECHNLGLLIKMTNLHQHLHYGHPIHNRNIGHDNLNTVGYQGSDIIHAAEAMGPITIQGAERNNVHVETKKVPSTINGTEWSHDNRDSSMDAADQPYKKMRSSIHHSYTSVATFQVSDHSNPSMSSLRHHSTVSQSLLQGPGEMHELPSIRERVNNAEEAVPEISDPYNIPMN